MRVSVGVCAHNEEVNLPKLLDALLEQELTPPHSLDEIIVVASGCTDRTVEVAQAYVGKHPQVDLIVEAEKRGKASAVNLFMKRATGDVFVLESADTIPAFPDTIDKLIAPLEDEEVGMTGGHPVPVNDKERFLGFLIHLMWGLHHVISLEAPKLGEIVAFKPVLAEIPHDTAVDEASIEAIITQKGYRLAYADEAYVYNRGPETFRDLIDQRKRIYIGHKHLEDTTGYQTSTANKVRVLKKLAAVSQIDLKKLLWTVLVVALDVYIRCLAFWEYRLRNRNPYNWDTLKTTKDVEADEHWI